MKTRENRIIPLIIDTAHAVLRKSLLRFFRCINAFVNPACVKLSRAAEKIKKTPTIPKCSGVNNRARTTVCINIKTVENPCNVYNQKLPIITRFFNVLLIIVF